MRIERADGLDLADVVHSSRPVLLAGVHGLASLIVEQQLELLSVPAELDAQAALVVDRITGLGARPS